MDELIPIERIENKIYLIRGLKVMLDRDLAELYGVETKVLNQAIKRNIDRFPSDFMFELSNNEFANWRSQFVTSNSDKMGLRWKPFAFTENGIAMLSSVLNSKRAIHVNIQITRTFTKLRQILSTHKKVAAKLDRIEQKVVNHDSEIKGIFDVLRKLLSQPDKPKRKIGFDV